MTDCNFKEQPHTRLNILTGDWILVSPHRMKRPWYTHFYLRLLRLPTVRKIVVGYEMPANSQRDITAEAAAKKLRSLSLAKYVDYQHQQ